MWSVCNSKWQYPCELTGSLVFLSPRCKNLPETGRVGERLRTLTSIRTPQQTQHRKYHGTVYVNKHSAWSTVQNDTRRHLTARCFSTEDKSAANWLHWQWDENPNRASSVKPRNSEAYAVRKQKLSLNQGLNEGASESSHHFWHMTENSYIRE